MKTQRPNILHILVDQQRADTISALGNPFIKTPNIDKLVQSGVAFTNAYSPSPVCIAARCSMIYGQYPTNTGCYENTDMPTDDRQTFMAALTTSGYRTHGIGKCHFTPDANALRGFETRLRQEELCDSIEEDEYLYYLHANGFDYISNPFGARGEMYYIPQISSLPPQHHPSAWIADKSIEFLVQQEALPDPWYLFSSFLHPHPPFSPPSPWHKLYRAPVMPLPHVPQDAASLLTYVNHVQNRYKYRDQGIDNNLLRCIKAYYYACISFIDFQIGRILETLERTGQRDNTLILFMSDHGEYLGDYHCFGKRGMHDASARIPMIVAHPALFADGTSCDDPVSLIDIAPTILSAAESGASTHKLDGVALQDTLSGRSTRQYVFSQLAYTSDVNILHREKLSSGEIAGDPELERAASSLYMAVSKDCKYVYSAPDNQEFLFDKQRDPHETRNKSGVPVYRNIKQTIRKELFSFLRSVGENEGIEDTTWREFPSMRVPDDPDAGLLIQDHPWTDLYIPGYTDQTLASILHDSGIKTD